jgi:hypothetical protein
VRPTLRALPVIALLLTAGCLPADGTDPPEPPRPPVAPQGEFDPTIPPNYTVLVSTFREGGRNAQGVEYPVRRELTCTVTGLGRGGSPITVIDRRTGAAFLYSIPVAARTPAKIPITTYSAPDLTVIEVYCTVIGMRPRDVMYCEWKLGDENGPEAPLLMGIRRSNSRYAEGITGMIASCAGRINVLA